MPFVERICTGDRLAPDSASLRGMGPILPRPPPLPKHNEKLAGLKKINGNARDGEEADESRGAMMSAE